MPKIFRIDEKLEYKSDNSTTMTNNIPDPTRSRGTMENVARRYLRMGFDFVSPKPISCDEIMKRLFKDFSRKGIKKRKVNDITPFDTPLFANFDSLNDEALDDREFFANREEILSTWPTGKQVLEADIAANHSRKTQNFHHMILHHLSNGNRPLVQPRTGVAHTSDEINILTFLRKNGLRVKSGTVTHDAAGLTLRRMKIMLSISPFYCRCLTA